MKTKKTLTQKPPAEDLAVLSKAMSELSKRTSALLTEQKPAKKPSLPKKPTKRTSGARSMDIVHTGSKKPQATARSTSGLAVEAKIIPKHATPLQLVHEDSEVKSRSDQDNKKPHRYSHVAFSDEGSEDSSRDAAPASRATLDSMAEDTDSVRAKKVAEANLRDQVFSPEKNEATDATPRSKSGTNTTPKELKDTDMPQEQAESGAVANEQKSIMKHGGLTFDEPRDSQKQTDVFTHQDSDEYASPRHVSGDSSAQKNDDAKDEKSVFDTEEYHPAIHDWSTLGQPKSRPWVLLLVLLPFVIVAIYFVLVRGHVALPLGL